MAGYKELPSNGNRQISLSSLSSLTGFPEEFIKGELLIEGDELSMEELRASVLGYLRTCDGEFRTKIA